jgi:hypothetical protein
MRKINLIGLFVILVMWSTFEARSQNWQIVPGRSVGPITRDTSEKKMIEIFGVTNVKRVAVDVGEGEKQDGTVLFPDDPQKKAYVLWNDPATRLHPETVSIRGKNTVWKTDRGVTIGTPLTAIEELNGGPFALTGFGWDYEGTIVNSNGGKMTELGVGSVEDVTGRTLLLRLAPSGKFRATPEYKKVLGDKVFLSGDTAMQKLNPVVYEMIVEFPQETGH